MPVSADSVTLAPPAGTVEGDLMIVAIALSYIDGPKPDPAVPVIVPPSAPADWTELLADYPGGTLDWGDIAPYGVQQIRLAVYARVASASEPANYTWDWSAGGALTPYAAAIKTFTAANGAVPSVNVAAAAALPGAVFLANPIDVESPSVTTTVPNTILLTFFVARNGTFPTDVPGTAFTVPIVGQQDLTPAINLQTSGGGTDPLGLGMFDELVVAAGATGVRTSACDVNQPVATPGINPLQGLGYAIAIQGCGGTIPLGGGGGPG